MTDDLKQSAPDVAAEVSSFVQGIDALATSLPLVTSVLATANDAAAEKYNSYLDRCALRSSDTGRYVVPIEAQRRVNTLRREYENARLASVAIPRSFVVSLVSQFDAFLVDFSELCFF